MANEKRLIDANAMVTLMCRACNNEFSEEPCEPGECFIYDALANAPTVDAVEVVHGWWIEKPNPWGQDGSHSYDCSICGERTCVVGEKLRYCPNCGAKMDGGNEE